MGQELIPLLGRVVLTSGSEAGRSQGRPEDPSHIPGLPQELVEHILDQISPALQPLDARDLDPLQSCTLVCRKWLPRSSVQLFKCVAVSPKGILRLLEHAATSERLRLYVRGIYIAYGTFVSVSPTQWLPSLFSTFTNIQHLHLRYGLPEEAPSPFAMLHPRSQNLASLCLEDVAVSNLPTCLRFFGNVGELVLRNVSGDVAPVTRPPHLLVRSVSLEKSYPNCLSMLKAIVNPFMLTTLKIHVESAQADGVVEALDDFLRESGTGVEHILLRVGRGAKLSGELSALSQCYDLYKIDLAFSEPVTAKYLINNVVRCIPASTTCVRLRCSPDCFQKFYEHSWLPIEGCLGQCSNAEWELCGVCDFDSLVETQAMVERKLSPQFRDIVRIVP